MVKPLWEKWYRDRVVDVRIMTSEKPQFWQSSQSENFALLCPVHATIPTKLQSFAIQPLGFEFRDVGSSVAN